VESLGPGANSEVECSPDSILEKRETPRDISASDMHIVFHLIKFIKLNIQTSSFNTFSFYISKYNQ
jgi:hypothetical protein